MSGANTWQDLDVKASTKPRWCDVTDDEDYEEKVTKGHSKMAATGDKATKTLEVGLLAGPKKCARTTVATQKAMGDAAGVQMLATETVSSVPCCDAADVLEFSSLLSSSSCACG